MKRLNRRVRVVPKRLNLCGRVVTKRCRLRGGVRGAHNFKSNMSQKNKHSGEVYVNLPRKPKSRRVAFNRRVLAGPLERESQVDRDTPGTTPADALLIPNIPAYEAEVKAAEEAVEEEDEKGVDQDDAPGPPVPPPPPIDMFYLKRRLWRDRTKVIKLVQALFTDGDYFPNSTTYELLNLMEGCCGHNPLGRDALPGRACRIPMAQTAQQLRLLFDQTYYTARDAPTHASICRMLALAREHHNRVCVVHHADASCERKSSRVTLCDVCGSRRCYCDTANNFLCQTCDVENAASNGYEVPAELVISAGQEDMIKRRLAGRFRPDSANDYRCMICHDGLALGKDVVCKKCDLDLVYA